MVPTKDQSLQGCCSCWTRKFGFCETDSRKGNNFDWFLRSGVKMWFPPFVPATHI